MKENIHPNYKEITVSCSCGNKFTTTSTLAKDKLEIEICSNCHPFYTGTQRIVDTAKRVDKFQQRFATFGKLTSNKAKNTNANNAAAK